MTKLLIEEEINVQSNKTVMEKIDSHQYRPMSYLDMQRARAEMDIENDSKRTQLEVLKGELELLIGENVDQQIQKMFYEVNLDKKKRAT